MRNSLRGIYQPRVGLFNPVLQKNFKNAQPECSKQFSKLEFSKQIVRDNDIVLNISLKKKREKRFPTYGFPCEASSNEQLNS